MSPGTDAVSDLQDALAEAEEAYRREQNRLEEANETLEKVQEECVSWRKRVEELQRLRQHQDAALHADSERMRREAAAFGVQRERLHELNAKVLELRQRLAQQPSPQELAAEAVAEVERDTKQRREATAMQWQVKQEAMCKNLQAAEAHLACLQDTKAKRLEELFKWRRRMALLRIGRAANSWKKHCQDAREQQQAEAQLLRWRKRLSRKQGHLDEEVALKAMELKKELEKEAAAIDLCQEEREEDLEQLKDEVNELKDRTAKAKELLRQHTQLNQALGMCPARSASQRIRRLAEACAITESQEAAKNARRRDFTEATSSAGRGPSRIQGQLREVEEDIQRSIRRSQSERRGLQIQNELRCLFA